ncbi:uncharacterized protein TNCV_1662801 [Trichonephila clavipes]|nr:uncharacterized protein TNCV_1662801 [Trichonephila clavipes]
MPPIKHIWDYLGQRVGHPMSLNELEARLQQIWNEMSQDIMQNLYASMSDRIASCIRARGGTTGNCGGGDRGRVAIYRPFGEVSLSLNRTVTCMVLKANDRRTSCPCHDEFRGPRSDYVRQEQQHINRTENILLKGRTTSGRLTGLIAALHAIPYVLEDSWYLVIKPTRDNGRLPLTGGMRAKTTTRQAVGVKLTRME